MRSAVLLVLVLVSCAPKFQTPCREDVRGYIDVNNWGDTARHFSWGSMENPTIGEKYLMHPGTFLRVAVRPGGYVGCASVKEEMKCWEFTVLQCRVVTFDLHTEDGEVSSAVFNVD